MANFSRDSLKDTRNALAELRGVIAAGLSGVRHYVGVRLQQAVPLVDADWNELDDIRRLDMEVMLARTIGNGVPAGNDGFRIQSAGAPNNFTIGDGMIFLDGWLAYNRTPVNYSGQPYRAAKGLAPALPVLLPAAAAERDLAYLDAWEFETSGQEDVNLVDVRIGLETCVRVERGWVVRLAAIAAAADPLDPATIPNRQPGHRYYPLALINRPPGPLISDGMIADLRRTHLTLESVTHAPLLIDDSVRGQRLESSRLAGAFRANLDALLDVLARSPEIFVYPANAVASWQAMTALQDVRAAATGFEQQARNVLLHRQAAAAAMLSFFQVQGTMLDRIQGFVTAGVATGAAVTTFLSIVRTNLRGTNSSDPTSVNFALKAGDLLGAVLAQERLNEALAAQSNTLPEGTVTANLISVTPPGVVIANTDYQLTVRVQSHLTSTQGTEPIRVRATAGPGWTLTFQGSNQPILSETVVPVPNQTDFDVVLVIRAAPGAAQTTLDIDVRPERRQQLVYHVPPPPPPALAIAQEILPGAGIIATLNYQGPPLAVGNIANVPRSVLAAAGGVPLPFQLTNLSGIAQQYRLTATALSASTGWQAINQPVVNLAPTGAANATQSVNLIFRITDQAGAVSPLTWRMELVRITGGANEALTYTRFEITFNLS